MDEHELWGWETFLEELSLFIQDSGRHLGSCTERYARYASERMETCVQFVSRLKHHIQDGLNSVSQQDRHILNSYVSLWYYC